MILTSFNAKELPHRVLENFEVYLGRAAKWHNLCLLYHLDCNNIVEPLHVRVLYQL